jgi:hypothetical protein
MKHVSFPQRHHRDGWRLISTSALTLCNPAVSFSTCFSSSSTLRCSLRNSFRNIA